MRRRAFHTLVLAAWALTATGCSSNDYRRPPCKTTRGIVSFTSNVGSCPTLVSFAILPNVVDLGGSVELTATAAGATTPNAKFLWTASGGAIAEPTASTTAFTCTETGTVDLTVTVSAADGTACPPQVGTGTVDCETAGDDGADASNE